MGLTLVESAQHYPLGCMQAVSGCPHETLEKHYYPWLETKRCRSYIIAGVTGQFTLPLLFLRFLTQGCSFFSPTGADAWGIPSSHIFLGNDWPGTKVWLQPRSSETGGRRTGFYN